MITGEWPRSPEREYRRGRSLELLQRRPSNETRGGERERENLSNERDREHRDHRQQGPNLGFSASF